MIFESIIGHYRDLRGWLQGRDSHEKTLELLGAMLAKQISAIERVSSLREVEFRVYSQWGDDGIIQWLVARLPFLPKRFIEFGVEDYSESNTRFLLVNNNWCGLVIDGSRSNISRLRRRKWFWRYELTAVASFLTSENIDATIGAWAKGNDVGLLHIDVDGNEYWLWRAIECVSPGIVIVEYNALFGSDRAITVPYKADFQRHAAHYSGQYAGASLAALTHLAQQKGYALIGVNGAGNNAYFVRRDLLDDRVREVTVKEAFVVPRFRESRDRRGRLDYSSFEAREALIRGLPVVNVVSGDTERF